MLSARPHRWDVAWAIQRCPDDLRPHDPVVRDARVGKERRSADVDLARQGPRTHPRPSPVVPRSGPQTKQSESGWRTPLHGCRSRAAIACSKLGRTGGAADGGGAGRRLGDQHLAVQQPHPVVAVTDDRELGRQGRWHPQGHLGGFADERREPPTGVAAIGARLRPVESRVDLDRALTLGDRGCWHL